MKLFIQRLIKFILFSITLVLLFWVFSFIILRNVSFKIPDNKTIVVIGDSHPECAINDRILDNTFNFSKSGTSSFYSYVKIRKILDVNPHIEKVVVGFNYADITESKNRWLTGSQYLKSKLPRYFFLMNISEFAMILKKSPIGTLKSLFSATIFLLEDILSKNKDIVKNTNWGGYLYHTKDGLEENLKELEKNKKEEIKLDKNKMEDVDLLFSNSIQLKYLKKIYELSIAYEKEVILINTPVYIEAINEKKYLESYSTFANEFLPKAKLINHASLAIPVTGYADTNHLNYKGAEFYSKYLKENGYF